VEQLVVYTCFSDSDYTPTLISRLVEEPFFKFSHSGHGRAVGGGWAMNRKRSLLTPEGLKFTVDMCVRVGEVNGMTAFTFVDAFSDIQSLEGDHRKNVEQAITDIMQKIDPKTRDALYSKLAALIKQE
tara:strand:+ start:165 stop:548 length:384 start_codon:yes stop_codon:yes gene_type:complete